MSTNTYTITAADAMHMMTPATLVSFIGDLTAHYAVFGSDIYRSLITAATEALVANAGADDAIRMMADAEIDASNPQIEAVLAEWAGQEAQP